MEYIPSCAKGKCSVCGFWILKKKQISTPLCLVNKSTPHFDFHYNSALFDCSNWCLCHHQIPVVKQAPPGEDKTFLAKIPKK